MKHKLIDFLTIPMTRTLARGTRTKLTLGREYLNTCSFRYASAGLMSLDPFFFTILSQVLHWFK